MQLTNQQEDMHLKEPKTYGEKGQNIQIHTYLNKFVNVRSFIIKSNRLTYTKKYIIKELVVADIKGKESVALEMNAVNNERDNSLK